MDWEAIGRAFLLFAYLLQSAALLWCAIMLTRIDKKIKKWRS